MERGQGFYRIQFKFDKVTQNSVANKQTHENCGGVRIGHLNGKKRIIFSLKISLLHFSAFSIIPLRIGDNPDAAVNGICIYI